MTLLELAKGRICFKIVNMKKLYSLSIILLLVSCAGTVPLPLPKASMERPEQTQNIAHYLQHMDARLSELENRALAANNAIALKDAKAIWSCRIRLPVGSGSFMETSLNKAEAMSKVGKKCELAGNSRVNCELNLNCFDR